jgi:hypothetical protein
MLEILTKSEFPYSRDYACTYKGSSGCILSDITKFFRISVGDLLPDIPFLGDLKFDFRFIPGFCVYHVPSGGYPDILEGMLTDALRELDNSRIMEDPEVARKALRNIWSYKEERPEGLIKVFRQMPSFGEKVELQYFDMSKRYKEVPGWTGPSETYWKASWKGRDLYIRIDGDEEEIFVTFSELQIPDIDVLVGLVKYEYVFRRFIA